MKCRRNEDSTISFSCLSEGDTFLFDDKLCMRVSEEECANGDYILGVILETGELLYRSNFIDDDINVDVQEVNAECIYQRQDLQLLQMLICTGGIFMKVYCALKYKPFGEEQLVGIAKTQKGALAILKREFPYMRGQIENGSLTSDANNTYCLEVREVMVEE